MVAADVDDVGELLLVGHEDVGNSSGPDLSSRKSNGESSVTFMRKENPSLLSAVTMSRDSCGPDLSCRGTPPGQT